MTQHQKLYKKKKKVNDKRKRTKTLNDVKPAENINKNPQSFLKINSEEASPSSKPQDCA